MTASLTCFCACASLPGGVRPPPPARATVKSKLMRLFARLAPCRDSGVHAVGNWATSVAQRGEFIVIRRWRREAPACMAAKCRGMCNEPDGPMTGGADDEFAVTCASAFVLVARPAFGDGFDQTPDHRTCSVGLFFCLAPCIGPCARARVCVCTPARCARACDGD